MPKTGNKRYYIGIREFSHSGDVNNSDDCLMVDGKNPQWFCCMFENAISFTDKNEVEKIIKTLPEKYLEYKYKYRIQTLEETEIRDEIDDGVSVGYSITKRWYTEDGCGPIKVGRFKDA